MLVRKGTRLKGKRHEALFQPAASRIEVEARPDDRDAATHAVKTMAAAFRMAERDLEAALQERILPAGGTGPQSVATRMHLRASPQLLAGINEHLRAIEDLVSAAAAKDPQPTTHDQHLSLTMALLPLKGRGRGETDRGGRRGRQHLIPLPSILWPSIRWAWWCSWSWW